MAETTLEKALRLVTQDRVGVALLDSLVILGEVTGDSGTYRQVIEPRGCWCSCDYGKNHPGLASCAHVQAVGVKWSRLRGTPIPHEGEQ